MADAKQEGKVLYDLLDKSRPYGTIGGYHYGAQFSQKRNGRDRYYDGTGKRIYMPGEDKEYLAAGAKEAPAPVAKGKQKAPRAIPPGEVDPHMVRDGDDGEINLVMWAKGLVKYPFAKVRKAIDGRYHRMVGDEKEAHEFLIDEALITAAEIPGYSAGPVANGSEAGDANGDEDE